MTGSYASARMTGSSALRRLRALARGFSPAPSAWRPAALGCVALLLAGAHGAEAGVNVWTSLGPPGGPPRALVVDPTRPGTLYVGTTFDGLFKSEDGGDTWSATGLTGSVLALAILPGNPMRLYAGGYDGIFRSTDGGGTGPLSTAPRESSNRSPRSRSTRRARSTPGPAPAPAMSAAAVWTAPAVCSRALTVATIGRARV